MNEDEELAKHDDKDMWGHTVQAFLSEERVQVFFTDSRASLLNAMVNTKSSDDAGRRHLQDTVKILEAFEGFLETAIRDGEFSRAQIKQIRTGRKAIF